MKIRKIIEEFETAQKHKIDGEESYYEIFRNPNMKELNDVEYDKQEGIIRGFMRIDGNLFVVTPQTDLIHETMLKILDKEMILDFSQSWYLTYSKTYEQYIGVTLDNKKWYLAESYGESSKNQIPDEYLEKYKSLFAKQGRTFIPNTMYA